MGAKKAKEIGRILVDDEVGARDVDAKSVWQEVFSILIVVISLRSSSFERYEESLLVEEGC